MIYSYTISTPKITPENNPLITPLPIGRGVIHYWHILFPPGSLGTVRFRIKKGGDYMLPDNPDSYIRGNDTVFKGKDFKFIDNEPYELSLYSWNLDSYNDHEIDISIFQLPVWTFSPLSEHLADLVENEEILRIF